MVATASGGLAVGRAGMRVNRGVLGWGVFFITVGLVPLAVRAGYVDVATARRAWELWPLILIGIGLGLVLQRTPVAVVGGLVVAVTFGLMGGSVLAVGFGSVAGFGTCGFGAGAENSASFPTRTGTLGGAAQVSLDLRCGDLTATSGAGSSWQLTGTSGNGSPPEIDASASRLAVRVPDVQGFDVARGATWQLTLPMDPQLDLEITVNAGSARLNLDDTHVRDLATSVNAGDAHIDVSTTPGITSLTASVNAGSLSIALPSPSGTLTGSLSANAGSLQICVPNGVALRFRASDNPLSANNFGSRGLTRDGNVWTNTAFGVASSGIDLDASANLGAITLNPESGCE
jgi:hypothetical protein